MTKNMMVYLDFNKSKGFYYASTCKYINKTKLGPKGENMLLHGKRYFLTIISWICNNVFWKAGFVYVIWKKWIIVKPLLSRCLLFMVSQETSVFYKKKTLQETNESNISINRQAIFLKTNTKEVM